MRLSWRVEKVLVSGPSAVRIGLTTVDRILPLVPSERVMVVTGASHAEEIKALLPDLQPQNILVEPVGRNTLPCIGLAAHAVARKDPEGVMLILPADHLITRTAQFRSLVVKGVELACLKETIVTLGITPTRPETGYGYIEASGEELKLNGAKAFRVASFHEKPSQEKALQYLDRGCFYWNSGMFIFQARAILAWMRKLTPDLASDLEALAEKLDQTDFEAAIAEIYPNLPSISIDYGIMEKAADILVLPADIGWSDIGSWTVAAEHWPYIEGNMAQGECLFIESEGCVVYSPQKLVTLIGVKDLIVVETEDALLVCPKDRDQQIKDAVETLKRRGRHELL